MAVPGVSPFEMSAAWEAFGIDRAEDGVPNWDCRLVAPTPTIRTRGGWSISTQYGLDEADDADLVIITPAEEYRDDIEDPAFAAVIDLARRTVERGAEVMSLCSAAFFLGHAGVLAGRRCTTHWRHASELARRFPEAEVDPNVLFVCDGPVLTSAGTAAALDLCLWVIRRDHGEEIARKVARRMVVPPYRDGGQAQYIDAPIRVHAADTLAPLLEELQGELAAEHTIESLSQRCSMSTRTFARRFRQETGTTPHLWLTHQRVLLARRMLEAGDDPVDVVAERCGFQTAAMLRHHFTRIVGTSPTAYRRTFSPVGA